MFRIAAKRLLAPSRSSFPATPIHRPLSTSAPILRKGKSSDSTHSGPSPTHAPRPPPVPETVDSAGPIHLEPIEPIVHTNAPTPSSADPLTSPSQTTTPPSSSQPIPVTPPTPPASNPTPNSSSTPPSPIEAPTPSPPTEDLNPDYSTLPSLSLAVDSQPLIAEPSKGGRTGAGRKEYVSSIEKQRRLLLRWSLAGLALGGLGLVYTMGSDVKSQDGLTGQWQRMKTNVTEIFDYFNKPAFKNLLPDPLPAPHQRPYTLLIDMEGMLVSSSWDRTSGWKTAKRPGVDYFLAYLSQFYEIVLFTSQPLYTAAPVAEKLDPYQAYLPYKLFRESTRYIDGKVVKDLSYLNRDLSKVIMLDTEPDHATLQPDNAIIIRPWKGESGDRGLIEMIPFLESIGIYAPADVRPILKHYQGKNIPIEYAEKEAEGRKKAEEDWAVSRPSNIHGAGSGLLSSMFGSVTSQTGQARPDRPMTFLERKRAEHQAIYKEEQKYWADHAEEFAKLIEEDKQKQLAEMKGSLLGFLSGSGSGPKPDAGK